MSGAASLVSLGFIGRGGEGVSGKTEAAPKAPRLCSLSNRIQNAAKQRDGVGKIARWDESPEPHVRLQATHLQHLVGSIRVKSMIRREVAIRNAEPIGQPIPPVCTVQGKDDESTCRF